MKVKFESSADQVTLGQAVELYKLGVATVITDGRDVTLEIEKEPTTDQVK